jgi:hypothetical protein
MKYEMANESPSNLINFTLPNGDALSSIIVLNKCKIT